MSESLWAAGSFALFEDYRAVGPGGGLLFEKPVGAIEADTPDAVAEAFAALERARRAGLHAAGFLAYELGYVLEQKLLPLLPAVRRWPLLSFGLFQAPKALASGDVTRFLATQAGSATLSALQPVWTYDTYAARFAAVRALIAAGDCYQINLTFPLRFVFDGEPLALFRRLRSRARAGHTAFFALRDAAVLSLSPELFVMRQGETATARPMKGTAARAPRAEAEAAVREALAADFKSRAENLMITDLLRNDLGRIAVTGSVAVPDLFSVETYPTLHQMTSTITARLRPGTDFSALVRALFPCGSVTGAPKIRAMEIIRALEDAPRGLYCGSLGHIAPSGACTFNVAIRTLTISRDGQGEMGVGSGVVADSDPRAEYDECLLKARFLTDAPFGLIETLLWRAGHGYARLERHLARLEASAAYWQFPFSRGAVEEALDRRARGFGHAPQRVRLVLDAEGTFSIEAQTLDATRDITFTLSDWRTDSADPFLFHKTTRRDAYEHTRARLEALTGAEEVVFLNERGELTEGSRTTLFVRRHGELVTPALACGLLPGTLRAELLGAGRCREAVLYPADLDTADAIYLGNSVRGLMKARRVGERL